MRHITIDPKIISRAKELSEEMGVLNGIVSSHRKNMVGFIGELLFLQLFGGEHIGGYDYDIILDGRKIDVKSSECSNAPKPHHVAKVFCGFSQQQCDYYAFFKLKKDWLQAWYVGALSKREFLSKATINKKGSILPGTNIVAKADQYQVKISDLKIGKHC
jgi:hypothetical protein